MYKIILAFLGVLHATAWCAPQVVWNWSNPQPSGNNLVKVAFQDSLHGQIVADNGEVSESSDGGKTWKIRNGRITNDYLIAAAVLDNRTILSLSGTGNIWRTTDGGSTWAITATFPKTLLQLTSCGDGIVLAVGMGGTTIIRSVDRGASWTEVLADSDGSYLVGVHCEGSQAFAVGDSGLVLRSRDRGIHWDSLPRPVPEVLTSVAFEDSSHGIMTTNRGKLLETLDGGGNWKVTVLDSLNFLGGIQRQGVNWRIIGSSGAVWTSRDRGANWVGNDSLTSLFLASGAFVGESGGIAVGNNGLIMKEQGLGGKWASIRNGSDRPIDGISVLGANSWLAYGSPGSILKSDDAGSTWRELPVHPDTTRFMAGNFRGEHGLLAGHDGSIALTLDGGATWKNTQTPRKGLRLFGIAWSDANKAVAVGDSASIWRTVDTGRTWTAISPMPALNSQTLSAVSFLEDGTGIIVGYAGIVLRSLDGGASWAQVPSPTQEDLFACSFRDASVGLAVGAAGVALTTKDGGASWTGRTLGFADDLVFGLAWLGGDTALVVGDWGHGWFLNLTVDAGSTWTELTLPTRKNLWSMVGLGGGRAALTGQDGAILIGTLQGGGSAIKTSASHIGKPPMFSVQRTGVPGQILIHADLPFAQSVTLKAYSMEGRLLGVLYRGALGSGTQSFRLPFSRQGPTLFRLEGLESASHVSLTKFLPF